MKNKELLNAVNDRKYLKKKKTWKKKDLAKWNQHEERPSNYPLYLIVQCPDYQHLV